jgi:hypothetical protein
LGVPHGGVFRTGGHGLSRRQGRPEGNRIGGQ